MLIYRVFIFRLDNQDMFITDKAEEARLYYEEFSKMPGIKEGKTELRGMSTTYNFEYKPL